MNIFGKNTRKLNPSNEELLDTKLYKVPGTNASITWADSVEGTLITGATGSGKSSGPGKHIAHAMLKSGFGMCILCAKKDERQRWVNYVKQAAPDREKDLVIFNRQSGLSFNFLQYEMQRQGEGAGDVLNVVESLMGLNEANRVHQSGGSGNKDERFWDLALRSLISRCITTLRLAGEEVSVYNMRKLVSSRFVDDELAIYQKLEQQASDETIDPHVRKRVEKERNDWIKERYFLQVLLKIANSELPEQDKDDEDLIVSYWLRELPKIGEKTSSIIVTSFMSIVEPFLNNGILKEQFRSGISPELLPENIYRQNKIVIIDFPIKEFKVAGAFAATIYKTAFQSAMERRDIENEVNPKPVGLWIDEYQNFCNPKVDSLFQTTARSSWVATVYITQNINNMYFIMGSEQPEAKAKSLLGNLNLKFFASNDNYDTNIWASNMIGQHLVDLESLNINEDMRLSKNKQQQMHYRITPDHFTMLKTGRKTNGFMVEAVVFKSGKIWAKNKQNFRLVKFSQK
ncbi:MAG: TraM recognition domain-containing protein [Balneolaceae bacterium]|nr:TraM recognition domain-containing protein [Balneolaceae bacterium]MBO6545116.1 TraM recognition domain-containing protein [Balneolaceae bacterium]MBO6646512.1 TraM recognition domain-containing protein [Balneolaceae bacterium]